MACHLFVTEQYLSIDAQESCNTVCFKCVIADSRFKHILKNNMTSKINLVNHKQQLALDNIRKFYLESLLERISWLVLIQLNINFLFSILSSCVIILIVTTYVLFSYKNIFLYTDWINDFDKNKLNCFTGNLQSTRMLHLFSLISLNGFSLKR